VRFFNKILISYTLIDWLIGQDSFYLLLERCGGLGSYQPPDLFPGAVEQDKGGLPDATMFPGELFALAVADIDAHDLKVLSVLFLQPIHDGIHLLADHSVVRVKIEHAGAFSGAA
jgi:hypothetical protein